MTATAPRAILRDEEALPFVAFGEERDLQLLQVDVPSGLWVVRMRFRPGVTVQTHRHTGEVFAFTIAGRWYYLEYPDDVNRPGSYLFEPAGSTHTLHVPADSPDGADVWFAVRGANLNLDGAGNVESVLDAGTVLEAYREQCRAQGHGDVPVIGASGGG